MGIPIPPFKESNDSDDTEWIGNLAVNYEGETTSASLNGYRDVSSGGGQYGVTERTSLTLDITRRFTYEFSGTLSGRYYLNERGSAPGDPNSPNPTNRGVDEKTYSFSPSLRYKFSNDLSFEARWNYTKKKDDQDSTNTDRNLWMIQLTYEFPIIE